MHVRAYPASTHANGSISSLPTQGVAPFNLIIQLNVNEVSEMLRLPILTGYLLLVSIIALPQVATAQTEALGVGDPAPEFEATTSEGDLWRSSDVVGEKYLVLYFYPAAMTGGCTAQACAFRDNRTRLTEMGAEVVGVSGDRVEGLKIFKRTHNLNFPLLSDSEGKVAGAFGVPVREGGIFTGEVDGEEVEMVRDVTTARWTFIIDLDGSIVYRDTDVDAAGDGEKVIAALEQLTNGDG